MVDDFNSKYILLRHLQSSYLSFSSLALTFVFLFRIFLSIPISVKSSGKGRNWNLMVIVQSKYPVLHEGAFGGTEFLFLGQSIEKKLGADYEQLLRAVFSYFWGQHFFFLKTL